MTALARRSVAELVSLGPDLSKEKRHTIYQAVEPLVLSNSTLPFQVRNSGVGQAPVFPQVAF